MADEIRKPPTIQDVARLANVSTATVSRALSFPSRVSAETMEIVMEAIERTGYTVNQAARNLRSKKTGAIVVLLPNIGNPFFARVLAGIETVISRAGYSVLIADTLQMRGDDRLLMEYFRNNRADGLIVLDGSLPEALFAEAAAADTSPPCVFACEWISGSPLPSVALDNASGAELAINHLIGLGHTKIGFLSGPPDNILTIERRKGVEKALAAHDLTQPKEWIFDGDFLLESGAKAARQWLALDERPTALFCANDEMAFGFISELHENGLNVPADVSVVGFDDIDVAGRFIPGLTTVHQPRTEIGEAAAKMLIAQIRSNSSAPGVSSIVFSASLVERESTRRLA